MTRPFGATIGSRRAGPLVWLKIVALAGCGTNATATASLPTWDPVGGFCPVAELAPPAVHVDPNRDPPVWSGRSHTGPYLEFTPGFSMHQVDGTWTIVDALGRVVIRDGAGANLGGGFSSTRGAAWFSVCSARPYPPGAS